MVKFQYVAFIVAGLILASCSGSPTPTVTPRPTLTPFPTFSGATQTPVSVFSGLQEDDVDEESTPDPKLVERGLGRYEALECGSCHGENGEGTDQGSSLIDLALSEEEFTDFMRSGGELGTEHQYSTDRLSANGGKNLYIYLTTLVSESE